MLPARTAILFAILVSLSVAARAEHNPLMPFPQQVRFGPGQLSLQTLKVRIPPGASAEDRFAARELSGCLSARAQTEVPVVEGASAPMSLALNRTGGVDALPLPDEAAGPGSREAYSLNVTAEGAEIKARSSAGIYYGVQTACQLAEGLGSNAVLPEVAIRDWPSLAYRGTMIDMSHGPLPTEAEVERQIDLLARWKGNQYYFYNEASIELDGYPLLNPKGRFTKEQVGRIIAYGRERHVDVIPCLELYGHLHDLFRIEKYSGLAAVPHGGEFNPRNPKVMQLLADWAEQFSRLFPSPFVHIGFDETWQIQRAAKLQGSAPAQLFGEQLRSVSKLFEQRGKRVMAWADIIIKYPELFVDLPPSFIAVAWEYDADPDPEYKSWLVPLKEKSVPHLIATGVNSWDEISPDFEKAFENIDTFLSAGRRSGAMGIINTVWTDDAQILIRMSWPAIAYGAVASWQSRPVDRSAFFAKYSSLVYPAAVASEVAAALNNLALAESRLQKFLGQDTMIALWGDPFSPEWLRRASEHREDLRQTRLLAEDAQEHLNRAIRLGGDPTTLDSLSIGSRLLDFAGEKFLNALEVSERWQALHSGLTGEEMWYEWDSEVTQQAHGRLADLMDAITDIREDYRTAWLEEYTPYRLAISLGRWDAEYEYWRALQARFHAFSRRYHRGEPLPPLESITNPD